MKLGREVSTSSTTTTTTVPTYCSNIIVVIAVAVFRIFIIRQYLCASLLRRNLHRFQFSNCLEIYDGNNYKTV